MKTNKFVLIFFVVSVLLFSVSLITYLSFLSTQEQSAEDALAANENKITISGLTNDNKTGNASGFLLTFVGPNADQSKFTDLKPKLYRTQNPSDLQNNNYQRAVAQGATVQFIMFEPFFSINAIGKGVWPGDGGNWTPWTDHVKTELARLKSNNMNVQIDIWNEPDYEFFWGRSDEQFLDTWKRAYLLIRQESPNLKIVGPSLAKYDFEYMKKFLTYAKNNNLLPDILSWHELQDEFGTEGLTTRVTQIKNWMSQNSINISQISINEIISEIDQYRPGVYVNFIAAIENNKIATASHSCWPASPGGSFESQNCRDNTLNGLLNRSGEKRSTWFALDKYVKMQGKLIGLKGNSNANGLAVLNSSNQVVTLIGNNTQGALSNYPVSLNTSTLPSFKNGQTYKIDIEKLENSGTAKSAGFKVVASEQKVITNNLIDTKITLGPFEAFQLTYTKVSDAPPATTTTTGGSSTGGSSTTSGGSSTGGSTGSSTQNNLPACGPMDTNSDSKLTAEDLGLFAALYGKDCKYTAINSGCKSKDSNGDGKITPVDLSAFASKYGRESCL